MERGEGGGRRGWKTGNNMREMIEMMPGGLGEEGRGLLDSLEELNLIPPSPPHSGFTAFTWDSLSSTKTNVCH